MIQKIELRFYLKSNIYSTIFDYMTLFFLCYDNMTACWEMIKNYVRIEYLFAWVLCWWVSCFWSLSVSANDLWVSNMSSGSIAATTGYIFPQVVSTTGYVREQHAIRMALLLKRRLDIYSPLMKTRIIERLDMIIKTSEESSYKHVLYQMVKFHLLHL